MNRLLDTRWRAKNSNQHGGARLNFLIIITIVAAIAYVGYQYVPVAFQTSLFKVFMQDTVDKAVATGQTSSSLIENQFRGRASDYGMPSDARIVVQRIDNRIEARVSWTRPIPLLGYVYQHNFDHTVKSSTFLTRE